MLQRIDAMNSAARDKEKGGANLLESHVFQFDFLNDPLLDEADKSGKVIKASKLPKSLQDIIRDPEKRKKLVIYINPPYAEAGDSKQLFGTGKNKTDVAVKTDVYKRYLKKIGIAGRELYAQFIIRIYDELSSSIIAQFSKLKIVQAPNFLEFRRVFKAKPGRCFLVPANTFDNVKGQFPIGFFIWHTDQHETIKGFPADVYDSAGNYQQEKYIANYDEQTGNIVKWIIGYNDNSGQHLGYQHNPKNDFQHQAQVFIINKKEQLPTPRGWWITETNIIPHTVFFSVRCCIEANWLNDRDQFLFPNNTWKMDSLFHSDCLTYALFNGQNRITSEQGTNHWIPFTEEEVNAREKFESHFMSDFIHGRLKKKVRTEEEQREYEKNSKNYHAADIFAEQTETAFTDGTVPIVFSPEAQAVMDAGRELWRYYHQKQDSNPNASLYDIRLYFQGTKTAKNGKVQMNSESDDSIYTTLIANLRQKLKDLAKRIEPKVYEYGFLKE